MSKRPFPVSYRTAPAESVLEIQAYFRNPAPWPEDKVQELEGVFKGYAALGAAGGLAGTHASPANSSLVEKGHRVTPHELFWSFAATDLDPGSLKIAVNLLDFLHAQGFPLKEALIVSDLIRKVPAERLELPFVFEPLPFTYEFEASSADMLVDLAFLKNEPDEARLPFEQAFRAWHTVAAWGGFSEGGPSSEEEGELYLMDVHSLPASLEFVLESVAIDPQAFDSVVNAFHKLHLKGAKLDSVLIQ
ncbi:MAG TPA: hypothetical protein VNM14_00950 [Planctomycetota bacterium]|jgi:hypothetical protein|nr:hypothetical protein [Planctomycetota bacterium]